MAPEVGKSYFYNSFPEKTKKIKKRVGCNQISLQYEITILDPEK